jgi:hypothetical protein
VALSATITADSTFIRSCGDGERHLEVRVSNVETAAGRRGSSVLLQGPIPTSLF